MELFNFPFLKKAIRLRETPESPEDLVVLGKRKPPRKGDSRYITYGVPVSGIANTRGLFTQTANGTSLSNSSLQQSMVGTGEGSLTIESDKLSPGATFHGEIAGLFSSSGNENLTVRVKAGSVVLLSTTIVRPPKATNKGFRFEFDFVVRESGDTTDAVSACSGQFLFNKDANNIPEGAAFNTINNTTFSTTSDITLDVTVQWSSDSVENVIQSYTFTLTKTF